MGLYRDMFILKWLKFIMMYYDFIEVVLVELMEVLGWVLWYYDYVKLLFGIYNEIIKFFFGLFFMDC